MLFVLIKYLCYSRFLKGSDNINYYNEIKNEILSNEINKHIKDYSKNRYELQKYCNIGKLLLESGNKYGENIIKDYSIKLTEELGKKYSVRYLFDIRKLYLFSKVHPVGAKLTMSHYRLLFPLTDDCEIDYYINQTIKRNLSKRQLQEIIRSKEYNRLPEETKNKLKQNENLVVKDLIKSPITIKNNDHKDISEKILQKLIMENLKDFLSELGNNFCFIGNEYKIKIDNRYNYIDLLLYNIEFNCYVVIELKATELKKEHIGQIQVYMNYIDKNLRKFNQDKTIGIIICKKDNKYVIEYCSDDRIIAREYELV